MEYSRKYLTKISPGDMAPRWCHVWYSEGAICLETRHSGKCRMVQGGAGWSRVVHGGAGGCTPMQVQGAWAGVEVRAEVQGRCAGALWLQGWCAGLGCYQSAGGPCAGAMCRDTVAAGLVCRAWGAIRVQGGSAGGCRVVSGGGMS